MVNITRTELFSRVIAADSRLIAEGAAPFQRPLGACRLIAGDLGISFRIGGGPDAFVEAVHEIYRELYRPEDLYMPALFVGAFMFRDVSFQLRIPVGFGAPSITPIDFLYGMTDRQKQWLFSDKQIGLTFFDQFIDLWDFAYGLDDVEKLKTRPPKAIELWTLARQQLEAAAATILVSFDKYVVIQNCIICVELLMKGALYAAGKTEKEVRSYQHRLNDIAKDVVAQYPLLDGERYIRTVGKYPNLIERRYEFKKYRRTEIGALLMNTQYIAGETMRLFSDRNVRSEMLGGDSDWDVSERSYPQ